MPVPEPAAVDSGLVPRFGVRIAGVSLLLPEGPLEHVSDATVHPLPGAGRRVAGITQLRGQPIVVLDPRDAGSIETPEDSRVALLVIGAPPEAGALLVDGPPRSVRVGEPGREVPLPDAPFAAALDSAFADADDPSSHWWSFDAPRLFARLAAD